MSINNKSVVITFLGNANHDSRVVNLIDSLTELEYNVKTISFDWKTENFNTTLGETTIYKLNKSGSSLKFYFSFFYLLIKDLLKHKANIYFAEDVYTLPIVYFFAKLNKSKIFYNSREIYAHLAGLRNKSFTQNVIAKIESKFIGKVDFVLVTGEMDKEYLVKSYGLNNILVLRNLPKYAEVSDKINLREKLGIPNDQKILLYQGVILEGRGIKKVIDVLDKINDAHFVIIGGGEFKKQFESETEKLQIKSRVHFVGQVNHKDLLSYTASADLGLALIENISLSYYYALPNKIFEYIMAGVPIICSDLPQMKKIVNDYSVGKSVNLEEDNLANPINEILSSAELLNKYKQNCKQAAKELNWEIEFNKIKDLLLN